MKVLIIAGGIHDLNGTGITLKNLFAPLPKSDICFLTDHKNANLSWDSGYRNIYVLGFGAFKTKTKKAHIVSGEEVALKYRQEFWKYGLSSLKQMLKRMKRSLINKGIYYRRSRHRLDSEIMRWLEMQKPTVIYSVSLHISLTLQIKGYLNIPIITHIMDDWISTEIKPGLMAWYWNKVINNELRSLIIESSKHIAISEKMAQEYYVRYGVKWDVFHNPIDINKWRETQKKRYSTGVIFKLAYLGRITNANKSIIETIEDVINAIGPKLSVKLYIYSQLKKADTEWVKYLDFVDHEELPVVIPNYDLLILPFYFDDVWAKYARLSMPTKASEYMISGVPILLISPQDTALYEFCEKHQCAFICEHTDPDYLGAMLKSIIFDDDLRKSMAGNAKMVAETKFDSKSVTDLFLKCLANDSHFRIV